MPNKDLRTDMFLKKYLLRDFRRMLNHTFDQINKQRRHYLCKASLKKMVKDFYTGTLWKDLSEQDKKELLKKDVVILNIPEDVYERHRDVFTVLILSTPNLIDKVLKIERTQEIECIIELFGNKYNQIKLSKFLKMEAIQHLWWGNRTSDQGQSWTFYNSQNMRKIVKHIDVAKMTKSLQAKVNLGPEFPSILFEN